MNKLVRAAQTIHSLSLAAMEEASRVGIREADIEHLFLALVITDQSAGRALRNAGITIDGARHAVAEQHREQLASLGVGAALPEAGRIVFHETDGYDWTVRARDIISQSSSKGKSGDSAAVLRELLAEPSGFMTDILARLGTTPDDVLELLDATDSAPASTTPAIPKRKDGIASSTEVFVPAPAEEVWELLADPTQIPIWEPSIGIIDHNAHELEPVTIWAGFAPTSHPDGKPTKIKPQFRRRSIELASSNRPRTVEWVFGYPDARRSNSMSTEFTLANTTGGTQVHIVRSWSRRKGWRGTLALLLRPIQKFLLWLSLSQTGSALSRAFR